MEKKKLVIIGGGFAGLNVAKNVDKDKFDVVLVDRNNYHSFPPLFYQVASSGLEPSNIAFPLRRELNRRCYRGCRYEMGQVKSIDVAEKKVVTQFGKIPYDTLVIAAGTSNNFFNIPDLHKHVYTLKSISEAIRCCNEILDRLERASLCNDLRERARLLTFVVAGAGPTGVEIAGALGEMKRFVLKREYPGISPDELRVLLVEGSDRVLRTMSPQSSANALTALKQLMVEVHLNTSMKSYENDTVTLADGMEIDTDTVIWTAGVRGVDIELTGTDVKASFGGRFEVDEYNAVKGLDDVYAIGDIALEMTDEYPKGHPQVAQVAIQQGQLLARNLSRPDRLKPFRYKDKGSMATIGRNRAVVDMGRIHLKGRIAWLAWMFVHLLSLLGMRNKTVVLINWIWSYFTFSSGLRLLVKPEKYPLRKSWNDD